MQTIDLKCISMKIDDAKQINMISAVDVRFNFFVWHSKIEVEASKLPKKKKKMSKKPHT